MSCPLSTEPGPSTAGPPPLLNPAKVSEEVLRQALTAMVATNPGVFRDVLQPAVQQQLTAGGSGASKFYGVRVCIFLVCILLSPRAFRWRSAGRMPSDVVHVWYSLAVYWCVMAIAIISLTCFCYCLTAAPNPELGLMQTSEVLGSLPLPAKQLTTDRSDTQADPQPALLPKPKEDKAVRQFTLGEDFAIIQAKLVTKILKGDYVHISDLIIDNIKLEEKAVADGTGCASTSRSHGKK